MGLSKVYLRTIAVFAILVCLPGGIAGVVAVVEEVANNLAKASYQWQL